MGSECAQSFQACQRRSNCQRSEHQPQPRFPLIDLIQTIAPVFLLIVVGFGFKRARFPGAGFWAPAERLSYFVLLPALIVGALSRADLAGLQLGPLAITVFSLAVAMTILTLLMKPLFRIDGPAFTSVLQGTIRLNSYLGFALAAAFYGAPGVTIAAVFVSVMMPTVNVICIAALTVFGTTGKPRWLRVPVQIATNPLILACLAGVALNLAQLPVPKWASGVLEILSGAALPLALLCVGAGLDLSPGRSRYRAIAGTCILKLAAAPAVAWGLAQATELTGLSFVVALMFAATPASPASYVLARQLGGDAGLMAGIVTAETAFSVFTLSAILFWVAGHAAG